MKDDIRTCDNFLSHTRIIFILSLFFFSLLFLTNKKRKDESCHKWLYKYLYSSYSHGCYYFTDMVLLFLFFNIIN